jgi:hypothetical protein
MERRDVAGHQGQLAPLPAACEGPLLARNRHADRNARCPLSGAKRKTYPRSELIRF